MRFHTQTAGSTLTAQQPENNIVRVTLQALAAVLGGTQSLHTNSLDEALGLPSESAAHTALRTQQILACESGVINTPDPTGGSYTIEAMTDEIESEAQTYIQKIDKMGGMLRAIEAGYVQREIQEAAYEYQRRVEDGERLIVGVNKFASDEPASVDVFTIDDSVAESQRKALAELKNTRDETSVRRALESLRQAAAGQENVVPRILEAVEALATVQEISDCLRSVYGEYRQSDAF